MSGLVKSFFAEAHRIDVTLVSVSFNIPKNMLWNDLMSAIGPLVISQTFAINIHLVTERVALDYSKLINTGINTLAFFGKALMPSQMLFI